MSARPVRYRHYKATNSRNERFIVLYRKRWYLFDYAPLLKAGESRQVTIVRSHQHLEITDQQYLPITGGSWYHGHYEGWTPWKEISADPGKFIKKAEDWLNARTPEASDQDMLAA